MVWCNYCAKDQVSEQDEINGFICCTGCGRVLDDNVYSAEITYSKGANGLNQSGGHFVRDGQTSLLRIGPGQGRVLGFRSDSHEKTLNKGKHEIQDIADRLAIRPREDVTQTAHRFYMIAVERNFTRGRSTQRVAGACLYIVCRQENKPYMLIDFSDCLQTNVYVLGAVFLQLCQLLRLEQHPIIQKPVDPSLFIHRFADRLQFGKKMHTVANTALRLVASMKRDWMQTGRRPSGVCGAALFIAAHIHGFERSKTDVVSVVHICEATLKRRLIEFGQTDSGSLTTAEFDAKAKEVDFQIRTGLVSSQIEGKGTTLIICQHKETGAIHYGHGLCRACYDEFVLVSGGMEGGSDPPAFQRAEQQRLKEAGKGCAEKGEGVWEGHEGSGAAEIAVLKSCDKVHRLGRGDGRSHLKDSNLRRCKSKQTTRKADQFEKNSDIEEEKALKEMGVDGSRSAAAIDKQWRLWNKLWKQKGKGVDEREEESEGESEGESVSEEYVEDEELSGEGVGGDRGRGGRVQGRGKVKVEDTGDMYLSVPCVLPPSQSEYASHDKEDSTAMDSTDAPAVKHEDCKEHRAGSASHCGCPDATALEAIVPVPVLVKRQLEIINPVSKRGGVKIVVTSGNEGEGAQKSNEQQAELLTLEKESLEANSETLSDIDDDELKGYFHNDEEVRLKTIIWTEMNKEYLEEQKAKQKAAAASEAARIAAFAAAATNCSSAADLAAAAAAAVSKLKKKRKQKRIDNAKRPLAKTAADATCQMLASKKLSSKVNYAVLARLFDAGDTENHSAGEKVIKKKENVGKPVPLRTSKRKRTVTLSENAFKQQIADVQVKEEKSLKVAQAEQGHLRVEVGEDNNEVERFEDLQNLEGQEDLPTFGLQNVDDEEDYYEES